MDDARMWTVRRVEDFGRTFWDVFVKGEFVARHKEPTYAELHADAMNAIGRDPVVQEAVERESMRRVGRWPLLASPSAVQSPNRRAVK